MPPVSSHEVFNCLLRRRKDKRETTTDMSFHIHCQGGQCAHSGRGVGGERVKVLELHRIRAVFSPSSRQGGEVSSRPGVLRFLSRIVSYHIVPYRIVSCHIVSSPFTAMWSVSTNMARIHCVEVPVKSGRENTEMTCRTPQVAVRSSTLFLGVAENVSPQTFRHLFLVVFHL